MREVRLVGTIALIVLVALVAFPPSEPNADLFCEGWTEKPADQIRVQTIGSTDFIAADHMVTVRLAQNWYNPLTDTSYQRGEEAHALYLSRWTFGCFVLWGLPTKSYSILDETGHVFPSNSPRLIYTSRATVYTSQSYYHPHLDEVQMFVLPGQKDLFLWESFMDKVATDSENRKFIIDEVKAAEVYGQITLPARGG